MTALTLDKGCGGDARLGLIVLSTDETLEFEARSILAGRDVGLLHARIKAEADVTPEALRKMESRLEETAELLPVGLDVIGYACTSASTVIGPARIAQLVRSRHPESLVCNPISAVVAALQSLGARRISYVSPYVASVTAPMRALLAAEGIETVAERSFAQADDYTVARICEADTLALIEAAAAGAESDAVFVSCTNLRSFGILETAEARIGRPVVSSNQALIWQMLHRAGCAPRGWGPGRLFEV